MDRTETSRFMWPKIGPTWTPLGKVHVRDRACDFGHDRHLFSSRDERRNGAEEREERWRGRCRIMRRRKIGEEEEEENKGGGGGGRKYGGERGG